MNELLLRDLTARFEVAMREFHAVKKAIGASDCHCDEVLGMKVGNYRVSFCPARGGFKIEHAITGEAVENSELSQGVLEEMIASIQYWLAYAKERLEREVS